MKTKEEIAANAARRQARFREAHKKVVRLPGLEEWEASRCCEPCPHHSAKHKCDKPKGHDDYHEVLFDHVFMERWAQKTANAHCKDVLPLSASSSEHAPTCCQNQISSIAKGTSVGCARGTKPLDVQFLCKAHHTNWHPTFIPVGLG